MARFLIMFVWLAIPLVWLSVLYGLGPSGPGALLLALGLSLASVGLGRVHLGLERNRDTEGRQ